MSSIRYFNQTAPFWDFIVQTESNGFQHPFAGAYDGQERGVDAENEETPHHPGPGRGGWGGRGRRWGPHPHRHHGPPNLAPPAEGEEGQEGQAPDPPAGVPGPSGDEKGEPSAPPAGCGARGPHPFGPHRGPHGWGPWGGRGRCGGRGRGGFMGGPGGPFNLRNISDFIQTQMNAAAGGENRESEDYVPPVDVFDTENAFVVHVSLAGAKKEDVAVSWDAEKSELLITGVIYRPGDEDFLKSLALDERQVGAFERKVRLGSPAQPAKVDDEAITAKLEDGVLRVQVPKEDQDYVEVKRVDVE